MSEAHPVSDLELLSGVLIALLMFNVALAVAVLRVILKFEALLARASKGAHDHFEELRNVRQIGV